MGLSFAQAGLVAPADPVAGEKVLLATGFCRGGSPTTLESAVVEARPGELELRAVIRMSDFSVPSCVHVPALSAPLAAGTYDARFTYFVPPNTGGDPQAMPESLGRVTVAPSPGPSAPLHRRLSGNWFDPAAPGTGVNIVQGASGALFAAWLTHIPSVSGFESVAYNDESSLAPGNWYVMPEGTWIAPNVFRGPLFVTRAGSRELPWDAAKLKVQPVGIVKLTFASDSEVRFEPLLLQGVNGHLTGAQTLRRFRF